MIQPGENKNSNIIVDYIQEEKTLKEKIYTLFSKNPNIKAKKACEVYYLSYKDKGQTVNNYLSKFRSNLKDGYIPSEPINSPHCRNWVWNKVVFSDERKSEALSNGWKQSRNRNRMLMFRDKLGSVQWFETGTANVMPKGSSRLADAKSLLCRAFSWLDVMELSRLCEGSIREVSRHWVFDVGVNLPRFKLEFFKKTHGLTIRSDGSHPGKIEVEETVPLYLQETNRTLQETNKTLNLFAENIRAHLKLVEVLTKEAEKRAAVHSMDQTNSGEGFWIKFLRVMVTPL